jgi:hypothetical protein
MFAGHKIWKVFTSVYLEAVQILTLAILWAVAHPGFQLESEDHILALFVIAGYVIHVRS